MTSPTSSSGPRTDLTSDSSAGSTSAQRLPARPGRSFRSANLLLVLAALLVICALTKGRGYKTWVLRRIFPDRPSLLEHPNVTVTRPGNHESGISPAAFVAADVRLPNAGKTINASTINPSNVRLFRTSDEHAVEALANTSGVGDVIVLKPLEPLEPNTQYTFEVNPGLQDTGGAGFRHFRSSFTTSAGLPATEYPMAFEKVSLPPAAGQPVTCLNIGPDHKLYASTADGRLLRFAINEDGTLQPPQTLRGILSANKGPRLVTGFCFDPASTPQQPVVWVNHGQLAMSKADEWSGKLSRLSGPDLENCQDYLINLPRSAQDHLNNQPSFGPEGALFFCQASNTAMGGADAEWGYRPERELTAAVLRVDVRAITSPPLDVKTEEGGKYDPFAPGAPVTLYATGVRNGYDLLWHSNGKLYVPVNGSAAGGSTPASPSDPADFRRRNETPGHSRYSGPAVPGMDQVPQTMHDLLLRVEKFGYYGHPNPQRGEYVMNGGNPKASVDLDEVPAYPVGTQPDRNFRRPDFDFGRNLAPTGLIEYKSGAFGGRLRGRLLITRYSGGKDIIILTPGAGGEIVESVTGINGMDKFFNPVDVIEDPPTGRLYVAEFGDKSPKPTMQRGITLLRPVEGANSTHVFRQVFPAATAGTGH